MQMDKIHFTHFIVYTSAGTQHRLETNIYSTKVEILNLKLLNQAKKTLFISSLQWLDKQTNRDYYFIYLLGWEPSVAKDSLSFSRRLPALGLKILATHSTQNLKTKLRTFPWFSRVPQSNFKQIGQGFMSYDRTSKQINKQRLLLYI